MYTTHQDNKEQFKVSSECQSRCVRYTVLLSTLGIQKFVFHKVSVSSPARTIPYSSTLLPHLDKIGRALVGGNVATITKAVFAHDEIRKLLLLRFFDLIDQECAELCRKTKEQCQDSVVFL